MCELSASLYLCWLVFSFIFDVQENFGKRNRCDVIVYVELHRVSSSTIFERNLWNSNKQNETLSSSDISKLSANYTVVHEAVKIYIFKDSSAILEQVEQFSRNDRNKWIEWYRNKIANRVISQCFIWHKYTKVQYSEFTEWKLWDICKLAWDTIFLRQETKFSLKLNCETNPKS